MAPHDIASPCSEPFYGPDGGRRVRGFPTAEDPQICCRFCFRNMAALCRGGSQSRRRGQLRARRGRLSRSAGFLAGAVLFARGWLGGGDVKLLSAATLWAGAPQTFGLLAATGVLGGVLALFLVSPLGRYASGVRSFAARASRRLPKRRRCRRPGALRGRDRRGRGDRRRVASHRLRPQCTPQHPGAADARNRARRWYRVAHPAMARCAARRADGRSGPEEIAAEAAPLSS